MISWHAWIPTWAIFRSAECPLPARFPRIESAHQAIVEPARLFEVEYGEDAAQQLVHDLSLVRVLDENNQVVEYPVSMLSQ